MTNSRLGKIRGYIKSDGYFGVLGKQLELIQREMVNPARRKRGEKLLASLIDDAGYLQKVYRVVKRKHSEIL